MSGITVAARRGSYNPEVRRRFANPAHSGDVPKDAGDPVAAEAAEGGAGARIRLAGLTDGTRWTMLRYRVFGCPHLIAAAEFVCERYEGGPVESVCEFPSEEVVARLEVPVEKTGRILLLEDAFLELDRKRKAALENQGL